MAVRLGVVESVLQPESSIQIASSRLQGGRETPRAILAELGNREREIVGRRTYRIVGTDQGDPGIGASGECPPSGAATATHDKHDPHDSECHECHDECSADGAEECRQQRGHLPNSRRAWCVETPPKFPGFR